MVAGPLGDLDVDQLGHEQSTIIRALSLYAATVKLDLSDAYLAAAALEVGPGVVASFDSDFDALEGIRRIPA